MKKLLIAGILLATPAYGEKICPENKICPTCKPTCYETAEFGDGKGASCARQQALWDDHFKTWRMTCLPNPYVETTVPTLQLPAPDDELPSEYARTPTMGDLPRWLK